MSKMRVHIIENGKVVNTIVVDNLIKAIMLFPNAVIVDGTRGGIGDLWDGGVFTPDPEKPARVALAEAANSLAEANSHAAEMLDDLITMLKTTAVIDAAKLSSSIKDWQSKRKAAQMALEAGE